MRIDRHKAGIGTGCALAVLLLAGCLGPSREERLDPMIGQDLDVAIEVLGQPDESQSLEDGRQRHVWQRLYEYDPPPDPRAWTRHSSGHWLDDDSETVDARLCETSLIVGFDFIIESWDYACHNVLLERDRWGASRPLFAPRRDVKPAN
jgi:hypothetical protein